MIDEAPDTVDGEMTEALRAIWERHRGDVLVRLDVLERAAAALGGGALAAPLRDEATAAAHRLAGSLGTFGLVAASSRARRVELLLAGEDALAADAAHELLALTDAIVSEVAAAGGHVPAGASALEAPRPFARGSPTVLIVEDDGPLADTFAAEAEHLNVRAEIAGTPAEARAAVARRRPDAVLLDLTFDGGTADALALLSELTGAEPPIPVLVSTVRDDLADRVEVARRGGRSFMSKSLPADAAVRQLVRLIDHSHAERICVLAVDDDPALLDVLAALLSADGYRAVTLAEPLRFWQEMERVQPDVVLLDVEMPDVNGLELCRVLRNDPRWATTPVLIVTARQDAATVEQIFAAGADDHVSKPLLPAELRVRVRNRVERLRLHRALEEIDGMTGIANRHTAVHALERLLRLATRREERLALALLDLDRFKAVNDRHGHATGDEVLSRFGRFLRQAFRGEDVVGRWGGEEFVVGMYGIDGERAAARLEHLLAAFSRERFADGDGDAFTVSFSAGVALHPHDGVDLDALVAAADAALYRAKAAGRARVELAGPDEDGTVALDSRK